VNERVKYAIDGLQEVLGSVSVTSSPTSPSGSYDDNDDEIKRFDLKYMNN